MGEARSGLRDAVELVCLGSGVAMLVTGLGVEVPLLKFQGLEAYGVHAGLFVLALEVAILYFWRIDIEEETTEFKAPDGASTFVKTTRRRGFRGLIDHR